LLLAIDLLDKSLLPQSSNDNELRLSGPFKVSHLLRGIHLLEEQLFHLDITFTNRDQEASLNHSQDLEQLTGITVLVVEDNTNNQIVIKQFLEQKGCNVEIASDGQEGVSKAQNPKVNVIFMDI